MQVGVQEKSQAKPWMAWFLFYAAIGEILLVAYSIFFVIPPVWRVNDAVNAGFSWPKIYIPITIIVLILVCEAIYALMLRSKLKRGQLLSSKVFYLIFPNARMSGRTCNFLLTHIVYDI
jgi:hypothetical protein